MQLSVLLKGRLRGMGHDASCDVMAKRRASADKGKAIYTDLRILEAPGDFPDGDYVLHLDQTVLSVQRRRGEWLLGNELLSEHKLSQPPMAAAS